jgi:hypothetical protein
MISALDGAAFFVAVLVGPYETLLPLIRLFWNSTFQRQYIVVFSSLDSNSAQYSIDPIVQHRYRSYQ